MLKTDDEMIQDLIDALRDMMNKRNTPPFLRRAAHTKGLGLLTAEFRVRDDLPDSLRVGLFKEPRTFLALIRCSSSNPLLLSDRWRDIRGFSIKLFDERGNDLAQDFVLTSIPYAPLGTLDEFYEAIYGALKHPFRLALTAVLRGKLKKYVALYRLTRHDTSPLDIGYWSLTPYRFGGFVCKYAVLPTSVYRSAPPSLLTASYLSDTMRRHLSADEASFDFCIQLQKSETLTPTEDISVLWPEDISPPIKLAEIRIPKQCFQTSRRARLMEAIAFSPNRSLPEHAPVGRINRARGIIYQILSEYRQGQNRITAAEMADIFHLSANDSEDSKYNE